MKKIAIVSFSALLVILIAGTYAWNEYRSPPHDYPDHTDLSAYRDWLGRLRPINETAQWERRKRHVLSSAQEVMGVLRSRNVSSSNYQIEKTLRRPDHLRHTIVIQPEFGRDIRAFLYEPLRDTGCHRPALVALHQTHKTGKQQVDGHPNFPNLVYGRELAERGYIVIAPDYPSMGQSRGHKFKNDGYASGTMLGIVNHMAAVDILAGHRMVDKNRIGAIGHSLGGHNAIFLGVFDDRIKVVVASSSWTPFHDYFHGNLKVWAYRRYMPRIKTVYRLDPDKVPFDFPELIAALAPRAFFSNSPLHDYNFSVEGVKKSVPGIRDVYRLYNAENRFRIVYPKAGHDFPADIRNEAYAFIDRFLKSDGRENSSDCR